MESSDAIPAGLCQCGCGGRTRIASHDYPKYGHIKGEPVRFLPGHHRRAQARPLGERFWERVEVGKPEQCWPWTAGRIPGGYGSITSGGRRLGAHRVAWEIANGPIAEGLYVCHRCDNPPCCNPAHLFLGTNRENSDDRDAKGRGNHGANNYCSKLTWAGVAEIRTRVAAGEPQAALAGEFGVTKTTINDVVKQRSWKP